MRLTGPKLGLNLLTMGAANVTLYRTWRPSVLLTGPHGLLLASFVGKFWQAFSQTARMCHSGLTMNAVTVTTTTIAVLSVISVTFTKKSLLSDRLHHQSIKKSKSVAAKLFIQHHNLPVV